MQQKCDVKEFFCNQPKINAYMQNMKKESTKHTGMVNN